MPTLNARLKKLLEFNLITHRLEKKELPIFNKQKLVYIFKQYPKSFYKLKTLKNK
jgi:hypothetical protein